MKRFLPFLLFSSLLLGFSFQANAQSDSTQIPTSAAVIYQGDTLFYLYGKIGPFTPQARADAITQRLDQLVASSASLTDTLSIAQNETSIDILNGSRVIMSITHEDTVASGKSPIALASEYRLKLKQAIDKELDLTSPKAILINIGLFIAAIIILVLLLQISNRIFDFIRSKIEKVQNNFFFRSNRFVRIFEYITPRRERDFLLILSKTSRYSTYFLVFFFYLPIVFAYLPWTRPYAQSILGYIFRPIKAVWNSFTDYLPNLFFIAVIVFITYYLVKFLKYISMEIAREKIVLSGFYGDWAMPTFKLVRGLIYAFALVILFPYLPGSDSAAFQGVSLFFGLLLSLGSSTAVANMVAGVVITYMRPFQLGDRVKIGGTVGDVMERTLLVTRVKTIKNEDITIPNANILNSELRNYTRYAQEQGLILNTTITIGYDVPWQRVEELLIEAALKTSLIEPEPKPFVLKTSLDDFYVSYQLNAYTKSPNKGAVIYSEIHQHILDGFHEGGVEILSPHYGAHRDGNIMTVPPDNLPDGYEAPAFRLTNPFQNIFNPNQNKS